MTEAEAFHEREKAIRARVVSQGFMRLVGAELGELRAGHCTISVAKRPELLQHWAMFHGGVTAFLVDNGTTIAASTVMRPGQTTLTAEYKVNFLLPAVGERLICRARVVKPGRTLTVVAADVFSVVDGVEKQTAIGLATIAVVDAATVAPATTLPPASARQS
jgi:uncharacterized protein (TIGR00369 family)